MTFKIWIAVTNEGTPVISAKNIAWYRAQEGVEIVETEQVYGIQLKHRVVGRVAGAWRVMTPTEARELRAEHVCSIQSFQRFPNACRAHTDCVEHVELGEACGAS